MDLADSRDQIVAYHQRESNAESRYAMDEHDDDIESEVEEGGEFEEDTFPILTDDDEETEVRDEPAVSPMPSDTDPDESEI